MRLKQNFLFLFPTRQEHILLCGTTHHHTHWKETPLFLFLNIHHKLQGYLITMSKAGIFWQFRLGKFGMKFECKIFFFFGPQINTNVIRRLGSYCIV